MTRRRSSIRRSAAWLLASAGVIAPLCAGASAGARNAANGLPYSSASAKTVQSQPAAGSCRARGHGFYAEPDPRCTPGALNPAVTQASIGSTICASHWTSTVRPAESITNREKTASLRAYSDTGARSAYEYDHLVALELGGAANDARNLWPEPDDPAGSGFYRNPKDHLERALNRLVCSHAMTLAQAQHEIATDWVTAYHRYG